MFKIANAKKDWDIKRVKEDLIARIRKEVNSAKVLMATSGGVDSTVAATLLSKANVDLHLVFIDTGLLRNYDLTDLKKVEIAVKFKNLKVVNARSRFLKALKGVVDPETKRQIIAKLYFKILEEEAKRIGEASPSGGQVKFLGQGTIYPDRIESAAPSVHADKIKSHHNVTLPSGLKLQLIEPLKDLYKDEVRAIGKLLKIPDEFVNRHPFPGPGLAIRIVGEVTEERLVILR